MQRGESRASKFGGGGESSQHRKLKLFVAQHPYILGLPAGIGTGSTEEPLPSGDVLDVFFQHGKDRIAVEVKSALSNEGRYCARVVSMCQISRRT